MTVRKQALHLPNGLERAILLSFARLMLRLLSLPVTSDPGGGLLVQLDKSGFGSSAECDEVIEPSLPGAHVGDVGMEVADRIGLELAPDRYVAFGVRQPRDAAALGQCCQLS